MTENIGKKIHDARKAKKLTLTVLASKIGSSAGYLSEIENGKKIPGGDLLISLSRELQLNFTEDQPPLVISEHISEGYSPEVKLVADCLQVKIEGKTREERLHIVEEIMEQIWNKYK